MVDSRINGKASRNIWSLMNDGIEKANGAKFNEHNHFGNRRCSEKKVDAVTVPELNNDAEPSQRRTGYPTVSDAPFLQGDDAIGTTGNLKNRTIETTQASFSDNEHVEARMLYRHEEEEEEAELVSMTNGNSPLTRNQLRENLLREKYAALQLRKGENSIIRSRIEIVNKKLDAELEELQRASKGEKMPDGNDDGNGISSKLQKMSLEAENHREHESNDNDHSNEYSLMTANEIEESLIRVELSALKLREDENSLKLLRVRTEMIKVKSMFEELQRASEDEVMAEISGELKNFEEHKYNNNDLSNGNSTITSKQNKENELREKYAQLQSQIVQIGKTQFGIWIETRTVKGYLEKFQSAIKDEKMPCENYDCNGTSSILQEVSDKLENIRERESRNVDLSENDPPITPISIKKIRQRARNAERQLQLEGTPDRGSRLRILRRELNAEF